MGLDLHGIIDAIDIAVSDAVQNAGFDRTVIGEVIRCEDDIEQAKYVVEDYMKQQLNVSLI